MYLVAGHNRWAKRQFVLPVGTKQLVLRGFKGKKLSDGPLADIAIDGIEIDNEIPCKTTPSNAVHYSWEKMVSWKVGKLLKDILTAIFC